MNCRPEYDSQSIGKQPHDSEVIKDILKIGTNKTLVLKEKCIIRCCYK